MNQNKTIIIIMATILAVSIGILTLIRLIQGQSDVQTINPEQAQASSEPAIETTTEPTVETTEPTVETTTEPTAETIESTVETTMEEIVASDYEVEEIDPETMYAAQTVNLREGPSTDYNKVGSLGTAQQVTVTGIVESYKGETVLWYQLDTGAFVNGGYLIDELPPVAAPSDNTNDSSAPATPDSSGNVNEGAETPDVNEGNSDGAAEPITTNDDTDGSGQEQEDPA